MKHVSTDGNVTDIKSLPIKLGITDIEIQRVLVQYADKSGRQLSTKLVLKNASLTERRVLHRLQADSNSHSHVPFNHSLDQHLEQFAWICMQDLGETFRPHSLAPITEDLQRSEAEALADIHLRNLNANDLDWLPRANRDYFEWAIELHFFQPAWMKAKQNPDFIKTFGHHVARVDDAANSIVDEMSLLDDDRSARTLVHTDINPSNVLILDDAPKIIDWGTARVGTYYLDVPHHFSTIEQAELYRIALSQRGHRIPSSAFEESYRVTARYIALRYIWWTLEEWQKDHSLEPWVNHYLDMISANS